MGEKWEELKATSSTEMMRVLLGEVRPAAMEFFRRVRKPCENGTAQTVMSYIKLRQIVRSE
eukprot:4516974-Alexandrium_andersonii.AAC.1